MELKTLIVLLTFCAGAIFTLVDIGGDLALAHEYWSYCNETLIYPHEQSKTNETSNELSNGLGGVWSCLFAFPTTLWIALCGIVQFFIVARCVYRGDARLKVLPKPIRILLLCSSLILLGPVVVNVFGAALVLQNGNDDQRAEDMVR